MFLAGQTRLILFTKEIMPIMKKQNRGTIINIGSTASLKGYKNGSIYVIQICC